MTAPLVMIFGRKWQNNSIQTGIIYVIITVRQWSWGKVVFSYVPVCMQGGSCITITITITPDTGLLNPLQTFDLRDGLDCCLLLVTPGAKVVSTCSKVCSLDSNGQLLGGFLVTIRQRSCSRVRFLQACVILFTGKGGILPSHNTTSQVDPPVSRPPQKVDPTIR